jgi:glycerol-3-phosphate acyltransferase PlsY
LLIVLFWAATRDFSHGVRIGVVLYPFAQWYADGVWWAAATGALMSIIGVRFAMALGIDSILAATPLSRWRKHTAHNDNPGE